MKKILLFLFSFTLAACSSLKSLTLTEPTGGIGIYDIQGCTHQSPYINQSVMNVQGVVTWKIDNGFFMQSSHPDEKACSSEGIFVFTSNYPSVLPGDLMSVSGKVKEFFPGAESDNNLSITEIVVDHYEVFSSGNPLPEPTLVDDAMPGQIIEDDAFSQFDPSSDGLDYWESLEGMLVEVVDARVVEARNTYGEIVVIPGSVAESNLISQTGALVQTSSDLNPERIFVELPKSYKKDINLGSYFTAPIIGVLDYEYGNFRILEQNTPEVSKLTVQTPKLDAANDSELRVTTYNLENWNRFDEDRTQQFAKDIVSSLASPDLLMLQEVQDDSAAEDDGVTSAKKNLSALINAISDRNGPEYSYFEVDPKDGASGGQSGANIRSVLLYRTDRVSFLKGYKLSELGVNDSLFNGVREPLIASFEFGGQKVILVGIHLVSNNLNTPLYGAIQPIQKPEEAKRIRQAEKVVSLTKTLFEKNPQATLIVLGDFNDVSGSDTINTFMQAGFENPFDEYTQSERYSTIYEGNAQQFDQILVLPNSSALVINGTILHLNTGISGRNQASDHDPVLLDLGF